MPVLAGLDIATTTGLAMLRDDEVTTTTFRGGAKQKFLDTGKFGSLDPMVDGDIGRRWEDFLRVWLIDNQITHVAIEAPLITNNTRMVEEVDTTTEWAGTSVRKVEKGATNMSAIYRSTGMSMLAIATCSRLGIPVWFVAQGTWRKEFTGSGVGKGAKDRCVAACRKLGIEISSVDAAEAVGIVLWLDTVLRPSQARRRAEDLFRSGPTP